MTQRYGFIVGGYAKCIIRGSAASVPMVGATPANVGRRSQVGRDLFIARAPVGFGAAAGGVVPPHAGDVGFTLS